MENKSTSSLSNAVVIDDPALSDEELKRLAAVFDVLIDVDYYLNYTKAAT